MNSFENNGIQEFLEYKRSIEAERPILTSEPRLVTVDGVDGSGKSTIAKKLFEQLSLQFGEEDVVLVDMTNLKGSDNQEKLRSIIKSKNVNDSHIDKIYMAGVNRAYQELIIPALEKGKIVVADRSEIDLLRFAFESGDVELVKQRTKYVQEGTPTHRLWAGNRVFIEADARDIWENLSERENLSQYDPHSLEDVQARLNFQKQAEDKILGMQHNGEIKVIINYGKAKAERVKEFCVKNSISLENSWGYADHVSDIDFLMLVKNPNVVNPNVFFKEKAKDLNFLVFRR